MPDAINRANYHADETPGIRTVTVIIALLPVAVIVAILFVLARLLDKLPGETSLIIGLLFGAVLFATLTAVTAYVVLLFRRPFRLGDRVLFPMLGLKGDVVKITLMFTRVAQVEGPDGAEERTGRHIYIPNTSLFRQVVVNCTVRNPATPVVCEQVFTLTYDSDLDAAEKILLAAAQEVTGDVATAAGKPPRVVPENTTGGLVVRLRYVARHDARAQTAKEILRRVVAGVLSDKNVRFAGAGGGAHRVTEAEVAASEPKTVDVDIALIDDPEEHVPLRPADPHYIEELAERIKQMGLLQPIVVQKTSSGRFTLIAGRFRLLACKRLGWRAISSVVQEPAPGSSTDTPL